MRVLDRLKNRLMEYLSDQRGAVAVLFGIAVIPVIGLVGATMDYSRAANVQTQLQGALDGAILTIAHDRDKSDAEVEETVRSYVDALVDGAHTARQLTLEVDRSQEDSLVQLTARMQVDTTILELMGIENIEVGAYSAVSAEFRSLEVALVLDNTGSMRRRMDTLRTAAQDFVDVVTEDGENENASISLVPYVAAVNIGNDRQMEGFIDTEGESRWHAELIETRWLAKYNWCNWPNGGGGGNDPWDNSDGGNDGASLQTSPDTSPWTIPGFHLDTFARAYDTIAGELIGVRAAHAQIQANPSYPHRVIDGCYIANPDNISHWQLFEDIDVDWKGCVEARPEPYDVLDTPPDSSNPDTLWVPYFWTDDSDRFAFWVDRFSNNWIADMPLITDTNLARSVRGRTRSVMKYTSANSMDIDETPPSTRGPNMACGDPIIALTNDYNVISNAISDMSHWFNGGTQTAQGVAWGWRALSPTPPFTEGQPYDEVTKIMVVMTDGENWLVPSDNDALLSDYSAYGHLRMGRMGTTTNAAREYIDSRTVATCNNAKAAGVIVYTVTFGLNNPDTREVWDTCASDTAMSYHVNTASELVGAFNSIAVEVGDLRLTR